MTVLAVISTISFSTMTKADEQIALPVITKPAILAEGTQRELTQAQIAELLPWAKDSKMFLTDLLDNIQGLTSQDKIDRLVEGIKQVVGESASKNSEMLMRYSLNRGLVINTILSGEMASDAVGSQDVKLRVLISSIEMALKYYEQDMQVLSQKETTSFVTYGLDYFSFLSELNKSIFDASAQYQIQRTALEWLQWDLYRDLNNASFAPQIVKINNALKTFPNKKLTDAQSISNIRLMKKTAQQLNVQQTYAKILQDKRLAAMRSDEERQAAIDSDLREKMREYRSDVDAAKINVHTSKLDGNWEQRREAVRALGNVVGGDVTLSLFNLLMKEGDGDVLVILKPIMNNRLGNASFTMKNENINSINLQIVEAANVIKTLSWDKRKQTVQALANVKTIECYRLLSDLSVIETDGDVKAVLKPALSSIEAALK